jgi:perosamine synthetase
MHINNHRPFLFRVLAPAGGFSSPFSILNAKHELKQIVRQNGPQLRDAFQHYLAQALGAGEVISFGSGKESLLACFRTLKKAEQRPYVGMSAYTCPDIAVACARAGFKVLPLEVKESTLELDLPAHTEAELSQLSAVVLSNLYGLADDPAPALKFAESTGSIIIDDACQALLSKRNGKQVGIRPNTYGVISFGRGKAICGVGGGAVIVPGKNAGEAAAGPTANRTVLSAEELRNLLINKVSGIRCAVHCLYGFLSWCLERPWLYWLPAKLPFLGLGTTAPDFSFRGAAITESQLLHAYAQWKTRSIRAQCCVEKAKQWSELLSDTPLIQPFRERGFDFSGSVVPIRYPVIFPGAGLRDEVFGCLQKHGLGASCSYPKALDGYPELKEVLVESNFPVARSIAGRILTLPVHHYVQIKDIDRGAAMIKEILGQCGR